MICEDHGGLPVYEFGGSFFGFFQYFRKELFSIVIFLRDAFNQVCHHLIQLRGISFCHQRNTASTDYN